MARDGIADVTYVNPGLPARAASRSSRAGELPFLFGERQGRHRAALDAWYRKYAATEMKDVQFCFAFMHDPGTFHSRNKKIVVPADIKGMKIRPAHATIGDLVTQLGGTNVQASAPEVRDVLEKGVADAITFPWGSIVAVRHRQGDQVPHGRAALRRPTFVWMMNKAKYDAMSAGAEEGDRRPLHHRMGGRSSPSPWADFEARRHRQDQGAAGPRGLSAHRRAARRMEDSRPSRCRGVGRRRREGRRRSRRGLKELQGDAREVQGGVLTSRASDGAAARTSRGGDESRRRTPRT